MDTLISVNGGLYDLFGFDEELGLYKVAIVDIDEDGRLTNTYITWYFSEEELANKEIKLTEKQWLGLLEQMISYEFGLSEEDVAETVNDIVYRCFAITGIPLIENLHSYIKNYMQR